MRIARLLGLLALVSAVSIWGEATEGGVTEGEPKVAEPFKLGTFRIDDQIQPALVLRDSLVIELVALNREYEAALSGKSPSVQMPSTMLELIERYESGLKRRLYDLVNFVLADNRLAAPHVHMLETVTTLAPILYPGKILNAAVNFYSHVDEAGSEQARLAARLARKEKRGIPYLFMKPSRGAVIGNGEAIVLPYGRTRIDWEVELGAVIGTESKYVSAAEASKHVFGYMVTLDISDRGGRPPGGAPFRTDWFVGKGHDTFAPQGPWIVPKEFYGDPMQILRQTLSVGDEQMQEATAGDMIHSLWELIEYASSIITLHPGDVVNNGTSGGVGMGTAVRGEQRFLRVGDEITATIDGIGTLKMPVISEAAPKGLTGAQLPAARDN